MKIEGEKSVVSPQAQRRKSALKKDFLSLSSPSKTVVSDNAIQPSSRKRVRPESMDDSDLEPDSDVKSNDSDEELRKPQKRSKSTPKRPKSDEEFGSDEDLPDLTSVSLIKNASRRESSISTPRVACQRSFICPDNPLRR